MTDEYQRLLDTVAAIVERYHHEPQTIYGGEAAIKYICERYGPLVSGASSAERVLGVPMLVDDTLPSDTVEIRSASGEVLQRFLVSGAI